MELDLLTKFNRGLVLSLVKKNVYDAVQTYRSYVSYLNQNGCKKELKIVYDAFINELLQFVLNPQNKDKTFELISAYQELIVACPDDIRLLNDAAELFSGLNQHDIALELLEKAQNARPDNLKIKRKITDIAQITGDYQKALDAMKFILEKEKNVPNNYCIMGMIYHNRYEKTGNKTDLNNALLNIQTACGMAPCEKLFLKNLIVIYTKMKDDRELDKTWEKYLKFNLDNEDIVNYSMRLIRKGDFIKGFDLYERRFSREFNPVKYPEFEKPIWDGKTENKTILVQHEQGYGDTFLFSRFFKDIKAKKMFLRCPKNLHTLFKKNFPDIEIIEDEIPPFDYHLPIMSIPRILKITKEKLGETGKYFSADPNKTGKFKKQFFNTNKFKVGISFRGNPVYSMRMREIPFNLLKPLFEIEGAQFYSLQYGELDSTFKGTNVINLSHYMEDFDDTAAFIENLDLLITIDNCVLNLAGALNKKTFGLFNYLPEFRWFDLTGDDVKWYKSVKPYQCTSHNAWGPLIQRVSSDIKGLIK